MGKGKGADASSIKLKLTESCRTVQYHARPAGWVTCTCPSTMPRAENRTAKDSTVMEDETLCPSGYIIQLWYCISTQ